ncbi:DUF4244 domain-containing protein [Sinomonas mesophila]|uniref:DUF4244 domain-containing protein n=1 Tax=Sinomonas mesophila TaxID=1531955 RepID=UPI001FEC247F|nr:DUF4244 domain-containing protein [Sinomonas mesophila]
MPTTSCEPPASPEASPVLEPSRSEGLAQVIELYPGSGDAWRPVAGADSARPHTPTRSRATAAQGASGAAFRGLRRARRRWAVRAQLLRLWLGTRASGQHGMATAEYAIATLGAVAFAGLLVVILRSDEVRGFLLGIIRAALAMP